MEQCWELDGSQPLLDFLSKILNSLYAEQIIKTALHKFCPMISYSRTAPG